MRYQLKYIRGFFLLSMLICAFASVKAQPNLAYYPFDDQFNSFNFNPAFLTSPQKYTLGIFPIGSTSFSFNNQKEILNLVSKFAGGLTTDDDYRRLLNQMIDQPTFHQNVESSLLSFTIRLNNGFLNFRIKESEYFTASLNGDLTRYIFNTDVRSVKIGQIQKLPAEMAHYREYSVGYSYKSIDNRLSLGFRAKLYLGKLAFYSGISGSIQNESNNYLLKTSGNVNVSFPQTQVLNADGTPAISGLATSDILKYMLNTGNPGLGVDLGFKYRITQDLTLSMSVIDLGKINWKTNLNSKFFTGEYQFQNSSIRSSIVDGVETITKTSQNFSYADSISKLYYLTPDESSFSKPLPITFYAGLKYRVNPTISLSLTDRYLMIKDLGYNSIAFATTFNISKRLSISTGYSIIGSAYSNIPFALLYKRKYGQFYIGTDNIASIVFPTYADLAALSFGTCFYLFTKRDMYQKYTGELPFYKPRKSRIKRADGLINDGY